MANEKKPAFSWGQPVCAECWTSIKVKIGTKVNNRKQQFCCYCRAGISAGEAYLQRVNPGAVPYPTLRKED